MSVVTCVLVICVMTHEALSAIFAAKASRDGEVSLTGWAKLRGELMIYRDHGSMDHGLKFPYCISGVFRNQAEMKLSEYDGKLVTVIGVLYKYADLPNEKRALLQRKVLADSVVPNFCFGTNVLLIETIKLTSDSHMAKRQ